MKLKLKDGTQIEISIYEKGLFIIRCGTSEVMAVLERLSAENFSVCSVIDGETVQELKNLQISEDLYAAIDKDDRHQATITVQYTVPEVPSVDPEALLKEIGVKTADEAKAYVEAAKILLGKGEK